MAHDSYGTFGPRSEFVVGEEGPEWVIPAGELPSKALTPRQIADLVAQVPQGPIQPGEDDPAEDHTPTEEE
jgi:hypothetical protein